MLNKILTVVPNHNSDIEAYFAPYKVVKVLPMEGSKPEDNDFFVIYEKDGKFVVAEFISGLQTPENSQFTVYEGAEAYVYLSM